LEKFGNGWQLTARNNFSRFVHSKKLISMSAIQDQDSIFIRKRRVFGLIQQGAFGSAVLTELLPNGQPHLFEKSMWDYKEELPIPPKNPTPQQIEAHNVKMAGVVKDVVAFYNSLGGFLVVGVKDNPREICGFSGQFDCGDLAKRIKGATQHDIDCHYSVVDFEVGEKKHSLCVLQIPQRPDSILPAQFRKDAPISSFGKQAYKRDDFYIREGDQSRPARSPEDFVFLSSSGRRTVAGAIPVLTTVLDSNLGPRDPSFVKFVGRDSYLESLWKWLCDRYTPAKLLAGMGGLGKTTIAREFSEDVTRVAPMGLQKIVWLSAKQQFYTAILDKFVPASRVDFTDLESLLKSLLQELGHPENTIEADASRESLIDQTVESLQMFPTLVIIDDVDSLNAQQQSDVFQTMVQIVNRTMVGNGASSRVLLTARLDLGAAPGQLIRVSGLKYEEFEQYLLVTAERIGLPFNYPKKQIQGFHRASSGSPTFASSILRLLQTGESLHDALVRWQGSDGEAVRQFAFKKELDNLTDSQIRTLYALCFLGESSQIELQQILQTNDAKFRDDLGELRKYHLLALAGEIPIGGARLEIPNTIRLMRDVIRDRVADPTRIEQECAKARTGTPKLGIDVGRIVARVIGLWQEEKHDEALQVAKWAESKNPTNPDIACLLGRSHMKQSPQNDAQADIAFRKAHKLGCQRAELFSLWFAAKQSLQDWVGLIDVTRLADKVDMNSDNALYRAQAYLTLGELAEKSGNRSKAADYFREGGSDIHIAFQKGSAKNRVQDLKELRSMLMTNYVMLTDKMNPNPGEHIETWLAFLEAFDCFVHRPLLIRLGTQRLQSWWEAVCRRDKYDEKAAELMKVQLGKFDKLIQVLHGKNLPDATLLEELDVLKAMTISSWNNYRREGRGVV
jgi:hypothetical protein